MDPAILPWWYLIIVWIALFCGEQNQIANQSGSAEAYPYKEERVQLESFNVMCVLRLLLRLLLLLLLLLPLPLPPPPPPSPPPLYIFPPCGVVDRLCEILGRVTRKQS